MTFAEWQQLTPAQAAREIHQRVKTRLSGPQQRAVLAQLADEAVLREAFAAAPRTALLARVPYFLKDLFSVANEPMWAGSTFLPEVRPPAQEDAYLVQVLQEHGAIRAGRTHLHEFAYGITGENPHYGDCAHPRFPDRLTGGSSSGSAAVVAAGIAPLAIGTDTGGSVRLPAAFCGLYGFRLTPRDDLITDALPLAQSYDTAGWFTANAADMKAVINAIVGLRPEPGLPRGIYLELPGLDAETQQAVRMRATAFATHQDPTATHDLRAAFETSVATYNTIVAEEAWENHRRWAERYKDRYDPGVWLRLSRFHELTTAQRIAAQRSTAAIKEAWAHYFRAYDFLLLPASPSGAFTKAECTLENRNRILALTTPASIGGFPVLTVPVALPSGRTSGLQIVVTDPESPVLPWALARAVEN